MRKRWNGLGMVGLAAAYFAFYVPYSALANALARGLLSPDGRRLPGLTLLPAVALGTLLGVSLFLGLSGWWRYARPLQAFGRSLRAPGPETIHAALWHAAIIGATTLNYSFEGVSILFMLLLMRGGVLVLSPILDTVRRRLVEPSSWIALALSLAAVALALADVENYSLSLAAVLSLAAYLSGYVGRLQIMERTAKSRDLELNRRYFVEEQMASAPWLILLLGLGAAAGPDAVAQPLRYGFSAFLATPAALAAFGVGLLYAGLSVFGSLIYVDHREYTFCVPVNRAASLLAGIVATYGLMFLAGLPAPSPLQLSAGALVLTALLVLARAPGGAPVPAPGGSGRRLFLFVCSGNTCRSPMAEAIARTELAMRFRGRPSFEVTSAGLSTRPGTPMTPEAEVALCDLGVSAGRHRTRPLTGELVERAEAVFCMTAEQRREVLRRFPEAAGRIWCLDPDGDIPDPIGSTLEAYGACARRIRELVRRRLDERLAEA